MAGRGSRYHRALDGKRWALLRLRIFERYGWRCVRCGRAGKLECDHITPLRDGGDSFNWANLQTLCRGCHIEKTAAENTRPDPDRDAWRHLVAKIANS